MKRTVTLTESQLHNLIKESVKRILNEDEGIDGHHFVKIDQPQGTETIDLIVDWTKPYLAIGSWEVSGEEARNAILTLEAFYDKSKGDLSAAVKRFMEIY